MTRYERGLRDGEKAFLAGKRGPRGVFQLRPGSEYGTGYRRGFVEARRKAAKKAARKAR